MKTKRRKGKHVGWDDELWTRRFEELREFRETHGHVRVPARWRGNVPLGRWVVHQRELYRAEEIEPDRAKRLEELGMEWSIPETHFEEHDLYMEQMLARLAAYRERYGHAGVTDERDHRLAYWIGRQRSYRNAGTLKNYRRERMDAAGFPWEPVECRWEEQFARLREFRERFGHPQVPVKWKEDLKLGRWVGHQRELHRAGRLPPEYRRRLEELGMEWRIPEKHVEEHDRYLEQMLARLAAYRERYGHAGVTDERDHRLAYWIGRQRSYRNAGTLKNYRRERMDAAGFPWEPVECRWEEQFARLREFRERFGHPQVPVKWKEDLKLGRWVGHQRELHRAGRLPPEYRRRLDEIGFAWDVPPVPVLTPRKGIAT